MEYAFKRSGIQTFSSASAVWHRGNRNQTSTEPKWDHRTELRPSVRCAMRWPRSPLLWNVTTASADDVSGTCGALLRTDPTTVRSGGVKRCTRLCRLTAVWFSRPPPVHGLSLEPLQVIHLHTITLKTRLANVGFVKITVYKADRVTGCQRKLT